MLNKYLPSKESLTNFFSLRILKPRLTEKEKVNAELRYAVWSGKIIKPAACSKCGIIADRVCGHHHRGYSKKHALDVV